MNENIQEEIVSRVETAKKLIRQAGKQIKKNFYKKEIRVFQKENQEFVTDNDLWVDGFLKKQLAGYFKDGWISEESKEMKSATDFYWVIDPIDGTNNFSFKIPFFCISLALFYKKEPIAGLIYDPLRKILYFASKNKSFIEYKGTVKKITIPTSLELKNTLVSYGINQESLVHMREIAEEWQKIEMEAKASRKFGSAALEIVYTALGKLGIYWIIGYRLWDVAAALLFAKNTGIKILEIKEKNTLVVYHPAIEHFLYPFLKALSNHD